MVFDIQIERALEVGQGRGSSQLHLGMSQVEKQRSLLVGRRILGDRPVQAPRSKGGIARFEIGASGSLKPVSEGEIASGLGCHQVLNDGALLGADFGEVVGTSCVEL